MTEHKFREVPYTKLLYIAMGLSFFIMTVFSESSVAHNTLLAGLTNFVSHFVPGIERMRSVAPYPNITATIYALNWLFFPANLLLFVWGSQFWRASFLKTILKTCNSAGIFKGYFVCFIGLPLLILFMTILSDFEIFSGLGFYSMNGFRNILNHPQMKLLHAHPLGIALWYSCWGWMSAGMYTYFIAAVSLPFQYVLRKLHIIRSEQPA